MTIPAAHATRVLTAVVGLCVLLWALILGGGPWFALVLAAALAGLWEFYALFPGLTAPWRLWGLFLGAAMLAGAWRAGPGAGFGVLLAGFWLGETLHLVFARQGQDAPHTGQTPLGQTPSDPTPLGQTSTGPTPSGATPLGRGPAPAGCACASRGASLSAGGRFLVYAGLLYVPGSLLFALTMPAAGVVTVLAAVMATDTGAYYAGHLAGGPKIWPRVSPKKTWSGSLGGLASALAASLLCGLWLGGPGLGSWLSLGACLSVVSQMGDFIESGLKRASGVKDSGALLPGHGGLLDRVDGLLPALLVYALARSLAVFP